MLIILLLFYFSIENVIACNRGGDIIHNHGGTGDGSVLDHKTGGLKDFGGVPTKADDVVAISPDDVACSSSNTDSGCCWRDRSSAGAEPDLEFRALSGKATASAMQAHFDSFTTVPPGPGVIAAYSNTAQPTTSFAALESCVICLDSNRPELMTLNLNYWGTPGTTLEACVTPADVFNPINCQRIGVGSQSVSIQSLTDPFRLVLRAGSFSDETGSIVAMDDLSVVSGPAFTDCFQDPTTTQTTITQTTTFPRPQINCEAIKCNFDSGTPCQYTTTNNGRSEGFVVTDGSIGNSNTGVRGAPQDSLPFYAGAEVPKGGKAIMKSGPLGASVFTTATFQVYEATKDIRLRACVDGESACCFESNPDVTRGDLVWQTITCPLPAGSRELWFVAENTGNQFGAAGVDNVQLLDENGVFLC